MPRQFRMVEITLGIIGHTDSLHDPTRAKIVYCSKRNDFLESYVFKTEGQGCTCSLLGIPSAPAIECQPPTNFHTRRKRKYIAWHVKPMNPIKAFVTFNSAAQNPKPSRPILWSILEIMTSVSARLSVVGKNSITRGSAFKLTNGSRSRSCHRRRIRRSVSISMAAIEPQGVLSCRWNRATAQASNFHDDITSRWR